MITSRYYLLSVVLGLLVNFSPSGARAQTAQAVPVTTKPASVPPSAAIGVLSSEVLRWDSEMKTIDVHVGDSQGHLAFYFTNVSPENVVIKDVHPGCGCTTAELPPRPWTNAPGAHGRIGVSINIHGTTTLFKNLTVTTDKGIKMLNFRVNILPMVRPQLTEADRARGLMIARTNRQAVFQGECAACHSKLGEGTYGKPLYDADCAICHEGEHRAAIVPDLHALMVPTSLEFWSNWISHGKPGSLMPAFSAAEGGPLNDLQVNLLAQYLITAFPPKVVSAPAVGGPTNKP
jgi:mono/diheme cytochrome c family protein